jgi:hypothetical protein
VRCAGEAAPPGTRTHPPAPPRIDGDARLGRRVVPLARDGRLAPTRVWSEATGWVPRPAGRRRPAGPGCRTARTAGTGLGD